MEDGWITPLVVRAEDDVLRALDRGDEPTPASLRFLLRRYGVSERADIGEALGRALAAALASHTSAVSALERAEWLRLFGEARRVSVDDRITAAAPPLIDLISAAWGSGGPADDAAAGIDACLHAVDDAQRASLVPRAIDELERVAALVYAPGRATREIAGAVRLASALLTGFVVSARLPYAMLAEELVQGLRRSAAWDDGAGRFVASFELNCEAAMVLDQLAALHRNDDYRAAAVIADGADYRRDGDRVLKTLATEAPHDGRRAGVFGLALAERLNRS